MSLAEMFYAKHPRPVHRHSARRRGRRRSPRNVLFEPLEPRLLMRFYLAQQPARGPGDRLLSGGHTFGLLPAAATTTMTTSVRVPAATIMVPLGRASLIWWWTASA